MSSRFEDVRSSQESVKLDMACTAFTLLTGVSFSRRNLPFPAHVSRRSSTRCELSGNAVSRRTFLTTAAGAAVAAGLLLQPAQAARSSMSGDYKVDAAHLLTDMRKACELGRGAPGMSEVVGKTRKEMNDFVALYRRNDKVSGSTSFSTLYTAINTLSGHYASYGSQYPVPEKRKKRLNQQFKEIDRALARGR